MAAFRILVVIPTLGRRLDTLERTLASISAQSNVSVDAIVVSPVDSESLRTLVQRHEARLIVATGHISAAVNCGWAQAGQQHRYVAWIGDDDIMRPDALAISSSLLERHVNCVAAFGRCDYIDISGQLMFTRRAPSGAIWWLHFVPGLIKQETCLFRRDAVAAIGGLDESLRYAMDLDLLLRLRRLGAFARSEAVLAAFCWHAGSITISNRKESFAEAQAVQRRAARGLARLLIPFAQPMLRSLLVSVSERINRRYQRNA